MDARAAVEFAFEEGLAVRGAQGGRAARVSLALHASRTLDPAPFLARDRDLAARARGALEDEGRGDLVLQVALWELDAVGGLDMGAKAAAEPALRAYERAKAWAVEGAEASGPVWIRDVPRGPLEREVLAQRLLLVAQARGAPNARLAAAALEVELADLPRPTSFSTILHAAAAARSASVAARTLEGLGGVDPTDRWPDAQRLLARLRASVEIVAAAAGGAPLEAVLQERLAALSPASAAADGVIVGHLAAAAARAGRADLAGAALDRALGAVEQASPLPREALAALLFMKAALAKDRTADLLGLPPAKRPTAAELVAGACDACRALRSAGPALQAMRLFDPEDVGLVLRDRGPGGLMKELVREGAQAAAEAGDAESIGAILDRVRRVGLRPEWDTYLRALVADAAAEAAARHGSTAAWDLALRAAGRPLPRFERAKLRGRAACEFVRASQTEAAAERWVDPYFPAATLSLNPADAQA